MVRKLPGNVCCSIFYCRIQSCLWALYIWVIFIEIQCTILQAGKSAKDFIFKMQQLHDPFLPSTASNFSLKRKRRHKIQCRFEYLCFAFSHRDDVDKQQGLTMDSYWDLALFLPHSVFHLLTYRRKCERLGACYCWGPNKTRDFVWQHHGDNGMCHPLQSSRVLSRPRTQSSSCFGCVSVSWSPHCRDGSGLRSPVFIYVTLQQRRTACSYGSHFQEELDSFPTGRKKAVCPIPQAVMDMARLESVKWKKIKYNWKPQSSWSTNKHGSAGSHFTRQWGKKMCFLCLIRTKIIVISPLESPSTHTNLTHSFKTNHSHIRPLTHFIIR